MITRKAILTAFEMVMADKKLKAVTVFCNRYMEAVRITRWAGGRGIHCGTFLTSMGSLSPEEKAYVTRHRNKYGTVEATPTVWLRK